MANTLCKREFWSALAGGNVGCALSIEGESPAFPAKAIILLMSLRMAEIVGPHTSHGFPRFEQLTPSHACWAGARCRREHGSRHRTFAAYSKRARPDSTAPRLKLHPGRQGQSQSTLFSAGSSRFNCFAGAGASNGFECALAKKHSQPRWPSLSFRIHPGQFALSQAWALIALLGQAFISSQSTYNNSTCSHLVIPSHTCSGL